MATWGVIITIGSLVVIFGCPFFLLNSILSLARGNRSPETTAKFTITDVFSLMFLLQVCLILISQASVSATPEESFAYVLAFIVAGSVWLAGMKAANQLGIKNQLKRVIVVAITFPFGIISGICTCMLVGFVLNPRARPDQVWITVAIVIAGLVALVLIRVSASWCLRGSYLHQHANRNANIDQSSSQESDVSLTDE